jgi:hypothetical protein
MKTTYLDSIIETKIFSDSEYDNLVCELYIDGRYICLLSSDNGVDNIEIVFPIIRQGEKCVGFSVMYEKFIFALNFAKHDLIPE